MDQVTIRKLKRYLTDEQLEEYVKYTESFMIYFRNRTAENLKAHRDSHKRFLELTDGKEPCQLIPIAFWGSKGIL